MPDRDEITLSAELPAVTETPIRIEVRCGETAVSVHEHGMQGSGSWAVWTSSHGGSVVRGGKNGYSVERALSDARTYVRREELRRLFHAQLAAALAGVGQDA